jgi:hypothetical protein
MNRTFLTELRKQFLAWRSLAPEHVKRYVEESERLFIRETQADGRLGVGLTSLPG